MGQRILEALKAVIQLSHALYRLVCTEGPAKRYARVQHMARKLAVTGWQLPCYERYHVMPGTE